MSHALLLMPFNIWLLGYMSLNFVLGINIPIEIFKQANEDYYPTRVSFRVALIFYLKAENVTYNTNTNNTVRQPNISKNT